MNGPQKEIMANMMQTNLMMFTNTLTPDEKVNFVRHLMKGLEGFLPPAPIPVAKPMPTVQYAKGPPTDNWKVVVIPTVPEIKFEGPIWDSAKMLPNDLPLRADSPAFVPK